MDKKKIVYAYTYRLVTMLVDGNLNLYFPFDVNLQSQTNNKIVEDLYNEYKRKQFEKYVDDLYRTYKDDVVSVWRAIQLQNNYTTKLSNKNEKYNGAP